MSEQTQGHTEVESRAAPAAEHKASPASIAGHPIHPMLIPLPIGLLVGALAADVAYALTEVAMFAEVAPWLLGAGVVTGGLAAVFGVADFATIGRARALSSGWVHAIGNVVLLLVALGNLLLRTIQGAEAAVVPWGVTLSVVTAVLLAATGWAGGELVYRHLIGTQPREDHIEGKEINLE